MVGVTTPCEGGRLGRSSPDDAALVIFNAEDAFVHPSELHWPGGRSSLTEGAGSVHQRLGMLIHAVPPMDTIRVNPLYATHEKRVEPPT